MTDAPFFTRTRTEKRTRAPIAARLIACRPTLSGAKSCFEIDWQQGPDRCVVAHQLDLESTLLLVLSGLALDHTEGRLSEEMNKIRRRGRGRYEILQSLMPPENQVAEDD